MTGSGISPAGLTAALILSLLLAAAAVTLGTQVTVVAAALPLAVIGGVVLLARPFVGIALLALFSQIDALLSLFVQGLPAIKLLTVGTLGALLANMALRPSRRPLRLDPAVACAVIFCLAVGVSLLFAENVDLALTGTRRIMSMLVLFFLVVALVDTEQKIKIMLICIMVSTAISGAVVLLDSQLGSSVIAQHAAMESGDDYRSRGATLGDATTAASILLAGTSTAIMLALRPGGLRMVAVMAATFGVAGIAFSFTRSAMLALGIGCAWLVWKRRDNPVVMAAAVVAGIGVLLALPPELYERMRALFGGSHDFTLARRFGYHVIGLELLARHPLFGIGPANFAHFYIDFDYRWVPGRTLTPRVLHNMYLAVTVETGLLGGSAFLGTLAFAYYRCLRAVRETVSPKLALYGAATLFGFSLLLLVSATLPNETNKYVWIFAGLATAIGRIHARDQKFTEGPSL